MAYTKFTGWENTTLPVKMRAALANMEDGISQGISDAAAAQAKADAALPKAGGAMSGPIDMNSKKITELATPTADGDAANKSYVDAGDATATAAAATAKSAADAAAATANAALPKAGGTMTGAINMGSKQITNLAAPTADAHAATKKYVDDAASDVAAQIGDYLPKAGGAMSGPIDMNSQKITEVPTPQANTDAANKKYVDDTVSPVSSVANSAASTASTANTTATNAKSAIDTHVANKENPHEVTYSQTGAAAEDHNHAAGDITSGTLGVARGGTGKASHTSNAVLTGNGTSAVKNVATASGALFATAANGAPSFGTLPVAQGGTGATTAANALKNLGLTATAAELNKMDGVTATTTELNYVDGVTSNIQTQLNQLSSEIANLDGIIVHDQTNNIDYRVSMILINGKPAISYQQV